MSLTSFMSASTSDDKRCVFCNLIIANHHVIVKITCEGFLSLLEQAPKWANINAICCSEPPNFETFYFIYLHYFMRIITFKRYRITFRTRPARKEVINQNLSTEDIGNCDEKSEPSTSDEFIQRSRRESKKEKDDLLCLQHRIF